MGGVIDTDQQIQYQFANGLVGEQYPNAYGLARTDNTKEWNEGHFYQECSNKGICDRTTGQCACFPGFEGEGCRRITCPNSCSGHGQCVNMMVSNAKYWAWDQAKTVQCECDPGYTGADCSLRKCALGSDPISTVYVNDHSVYKIQFGAVQGKSLAETPNGEMHFTISYKDDYGDVWTTSANTMYYQAQPQVAAGARGRRLLAAKSQGKLAFNPQGADGANTPTISLPFFMNPSAYAKIVDVHEANLADPTSTKGMKLAELYNQKFSFDRSFISEQVNASIQALPADTVRHAYVHTAYNEMSGKNVMVYPSMAVPDFSTIADGKSFEDFDTKFGSAACSADDGGAAGCANKGKFKNGQSIAVNDINYRFPYWIAEGSTSDQGAAAAAKAYTNCDEAAVCVFITLPEAVGTKVMNVNYKFKPSIVALKGGKSDDFVADSYQLTKMPEVSSHSGPGSLGYVTVKEVGTSRNWHKLIDGTPIIKFNSNTPLYACSRRGLCDYETGECKCFAGYSGYKCQSKSVLGY